MFIHPLKINHKLYLEVSGEDSVLLLCKINVITKNSTTAEKEKANRVSAMRIMG